MKEFTDTELANEQWRDIEGYDGMYQVSDLGRVRSLKFGKVRVLRPGKTKDGYLRVDLYRNGKYNHSLVHRLVAQAFIPNDDESKTIINHRNECKSENKLSNLEWCTVQYNNTYNDLHLRKNYHKITDEIKPIYRPELSTKENIELFRLNGIECSRRSIWKLRKDLGLINNKTKRDEIKDIYDPNLSIADNLELLRQQGIECSKDTVVRLRKDLKLNGSRPNYKLNKLKKLYDPNLTYQQNLELFKANGIECGGGTIYRLRKELGLSKKVHQTLINRL